MTGWIKICGLNSAEAVSAALQAGVDAIGFVFAPSPRRVSPERAAELARTVRQQLTCVAVTQHPGQQEIDAIVQQFHPDLLQSDLDDFSQLHLPRRLARLPVVRSSDAPRPSYPVRMLFEGARSGSGEPADWSQATALARQSRLILAGGLHAGNVAAAIHAVRPFGVDISSGVETRPGVKSPARIVEFVQAARLAFTEIEA
jgi:phosphoribosylanthranilate isomerase